MSETPKRLVKDTSRKPKEASEKRRVELEKEESLLYRILFKSSGREESKELVLENACKIH